MSKQAIVLKEWSKIINECSLLLNKPPRTKGDMHDKGTTFTIKCTLPAV